MHGLVGIGGIHGEEHDRPGGGIVPGIGETPAFERATRNKVDTKQSPRLQVQRGRGRGSHASSKDLLRPIGALHLQGFQYFGMVCPLLERLHEDGTARDIAGNRTLFYDPSHSQLMACGMGSLDFAIQC